MELYLEKAAWDKFIEIRTKDCNCRDASYDHCRKFFIDNHKCIDKRDELALHLFAYLASWGMLRNSFIAQKDYLFHKGVLEVLCDNKYMELLCWEPLEDEENDSKIDLILELKDKIVSKYKEGFYYADSTAKEKKIESVTETLSSKILLGTYGCVPAFDVYFVKGLKSRPKTFSKKGLNAIIEYARDNKLFINECKKNLRKLFPEISELYSTMKIIDILIWGKGIQI